MDDDEEIRPLACQERGCRVLVYERLDCPILVCQHGDNPEAVLEIDGCSLGCVRREAFDAWVDRVHAYESAPARGAASPAGREHRATHDVGEQEASGG